MKLSKPSLTGAFQFENVSTAIATLKTLKDFDIKDNHIQKGITQIHSVARLQEIKSGKLKDLIKNNLYSKDNSRAKKTRQ